MSQSPNAVRLINLNVQMLQFNLILRFNIKYFLRIKIIITVNELFIEKVGNYLNRG